MEKNIQREKKVSDEECEKRKQIEKGDRGEKEYIKVFAYKLKTNMALKMLSTTAQHICAYLYN